MSYVPFSMNLAETGVLQAIRQRADALGLAIEIHAIAPYDIRKKIMGYNARIVGKSGKLKRALWWVPFSTVARSFTRWLGEIERSQPHD